MGANEKTKLFNITKKSYFWFRYLYELMKETYMKRFTVIQSSSIRLKTDVPVLCLEMQKHKTVHLADEFPL